MGRWKDGALIYSTMTANTKETSRTADNMGKGVRTIPVARRIRDRGRTVMRLRYPPKRHIFALQSFDWHQCLGRIHGVGKTTMVAGSVYEGQFDAGRRNGSGKLSLPCGLTYGIEGTITPVRTADVGAIEGEFLDGKPHGRGIMNSTLTGWRYEGSFER